MARLQTTASSMLETLHEAGRKPGPLEAPADAITKPPAGLAPGVVTCDAAEDLAVGLSGLARTKRSLALA